MVAAGGADPGGSLKLGLPRLITRFWKGRLYLRLCIFNGDQYGLHSQRDQRAYKNISSSIATIQLCSVMHLSSIARDLLS